jgi:hypothetical protein
LIYCRWCWCWGEGFFREIQRGIVGVILLGDMGHFHILLFLGWDLLWGSLSGLKGAFYMQKVLIQWYQIRIRII